MIRSSFFRRRPKTAGVLIAAVSIIVLIGAAEAVLSIFFPFPISTTGSVRSDKGAVYGWGFDSHQLIRVIDPDSGKNYVERVNNRGWRDRDRFFDNKKNAFRILILGDSHVFGYIVPRRFVFTRLLEEKLRNIGYNAEVINISTPGWGTDQELEALKREGLRYKPDLVVIHVTHGNDLTENLWHTTSGKYARRKPFYYEIGPDGRVVRKANPGFTKERSAITRKYIISQSEILKRLEVIRNAFERRNAPAVEIIGKHILYLKELMGDDFNAAVAESFRAMIGESTSEDDIRRALRRHNLMKYEKDVLNAARNYTYFRDWAPTHYVMGKFPFAEDAWALFFALIREAKRLAHSEDAAFALSLDMDLALYAWHVSKGGIPERPDGAARFLSSVDPLRAFAQRHDIDIVENVEKLERAKNDFHMNAKGNRAMAENLYRYLLKYHRRTLDRHRR